MRIDTYSLLILADNGHEMRCDLFIGGFPEGKRNQRKGEEEGLLDDRQCLSLESDQKATINGKSEHSRKETAVQFAVVAHLVDDGTELGGKGMDSFCGSVTFLYASFDKSQYMRNRISVGLLNSR